MNHEEVKGHEELLMHLNALMVKNYNHEEVKDREELLMSLNALMVKKL